MQELLNEAQDYRSRMVEWRRKIHSCPETGFYLPKTSAMVAGLLEEFGYQVQTGFAESAVLGILDTGRPGNTIAVRADMDALGMQDEKDVPYRSARDGVCHACGHDVHTALLLGLASYLSEHRDQIPGGCVKLIFQPAEEGPAPGGAKLIVDSGVLDGVDAIFGAHCQPQYPAGVMGCRYGNFFASGDFFEVKLKGRGCHAASPHKGNDLIPIAMEMIQAIQNIRSREIPPMKTAVISVCSINAGVLSTKNVLPSELTFGGTFRAHDSQVRDYIAKRLEQIVRDISRMNGITCEFEDSFAFPSFANDRDVTDIICKSAAEVLGEDKVMKRTEPEMGSEHFAWYTKKFKGAFFFFGVKNEEKGLTASLHNPGFDIDEDAMVPALAVYISTLYHLLERQDS